MIELAMPYASACAHALAVARKNHCSCAQAVFMFQRAFQDVGNNLHIPMRMQRETFTGCDPIFINNPQRAEAHEARIVILVKGKRVFSVEPAVVAAPSFIAAPNTDHWTILVITTI